MTIRLMRIGSSASVGAFLITDRVTIESRRASEGSLHVEEDVLRPFRPKAPARDAAAGLTRVLTICLASGRQPADQPGESIEYVSKPLGQIRLNPKIDSRGALRDHHDEGAALVRLTGARRAGAPAASTSSPGASSRQKVCGHSTVGAAAVGGPRP
jgi:hypothetical protein